MGEQLPRLGSRVASEQLRRRDQCVCLCVCVHGSFVVFVMQERLTRETMLSARRERSTKESSRSSPQSWACRCLMLTSRSVPIRPRWLATRWSTPSSVRVRVLTTWACCCCCCCCCCCWQFAVGDEANGRGRVGGGRPEGVHRVVQIALRGRSGRHWPFAGERPLIRDESCTFRSISIGFGRLIDEIDGKMHGP